VDEAEFAGVVGWEHAAVEENLREGADAHDGGLEVVRGDAEEGGALFEETLEATDAGLQFVEVRRLFGDGRL
jgi:hypothetical protein